MPNDRPQFKGIYKAKVNDRVNLKIEMRTFLGRTDSSELTQSNGRWVWFDARRPADTILDRDILPTVERLCERILQMDEEFMKQNPNEFRDEAGALWRRVDPTK